ncbi:MAG: 2Fe-2S iron-sulfur cluster-binding protein [Nitrospinaceae bacterium]
MSWDGFREFKILSKIPEAENIFSFYLSPVDGAPLPGFLPGQYLTFQLKIPGRDKPVIRCYSLSDAPSHADRYRVTIKKILPPRNQPQASPGLVSSYFTDQLRENDVVTAKAPSGVFYLDPKGENPVVLLAGGIGMTPLLSMLNAVVDSGSKREVWFLLGVRNGREHPMKEHLERVAAENENIHLRVIYSRPTPEDTQGRDFHHQGHVNGDLLKRVLPSKDFDFYLCGPDAMMKSLRQDLREWGVPDNRVFYELFGPTPPVSQTPAGVKPADRKKTLAVTFAQSGKTVEWDGSADSLLEFAEDHGVIIDFGCRSGNCGTCSTRVLSGEVEYTEKPEAKIEDGHCLTCSSTPKTDLVLDA